MRFNFPICVFDLETTDCDSHGIIEIGATMLTRELHRVVGAFQYTVFSEFPVSSFVTELTGHSQETITRSPSWSKVSALFEKWVEDRAECDIKKVRLAAWGNYFDVNCLRNEYQRNGHSYPFSGTVIDVKTVALTWLALSGKRTDKCSVQGVAEIMGIKPDGLYHRADVDAVATAEIFRRAISDLKGGVWIDKQYVRVSK